MVGASADSSDVAEFGDEKRCRLDGDVGTEAEDAVFVANCAPCVYPCNVDVFVKILHLGVPSYHPPNGKR